METQLTNSEIKAKQQLLKNYPLADKAFTTLEQNDGSLEITFDILWAEKIGLTFNHNKSKSLWKVTLKVLQQEICGSKGFQTQFQEYTKNPGSAPLLTGLIVSLITISTLPLDPPIATVIVLYILKVGLKIFCEYTETIDESES